MRGRTQFLINQVHPCGPPLPLPLPSHAGGLVHGAAPSSRLQNLNIIRPQSVGTHFLITHQLDSPSPL